MTSTDSAHDTFWANDMDLSTFPSPTEAPVTTNSKTQTIPTETTGEDGPEHPHEQGQRKVTMTGQEMADLYATGVSGEEVAAKAGCSPGRVTQLVKAATGMTPKQYRISKGWSSLLVTLKKGTGSRRPSERAGTPARRT